MKHAKISVHLQDRDGNYERHLEVPGYACEIDGIPLVVHRSVGLDPEGDTHWTVSEPRSGRAIWDGSDSFDTPDKPYPRSYAIHRAECVIAAKGGPEAVERMVKKMLANEPQGNQ